MPSRVRSKLIVAVNAFVMAAILVIAGCNSHRSAPSGALPSPTNVGPVPGPQFAAPVAFNPLAGDPVALQDGRRLFNWYNCSGCHGGHAGGGMGPSLRDKTWIYGERDDQIFDSIAEGRSKGMPAWGSKIPSEQIWELVAYIKSMRTPAEPEPPVEPANEETPNPSDNTPYGIGSHQH
ncbi:MAG: c-type cytochrome [Acidobacteriota bacterium]